MELQWFEDEIGRFDEHIKYLNRVNCDLPRSSQDMPSYTLDEWKQLEPEKKAKVIQIIEKLAIPQRLPKRISINRNEQSTLVCINDMLNDKKLNNLMFFDRGHSHRSNLLDNFKTLSSELSQSIANQTKFYRYHLNEVNVKLIYDIYSICGQINDFPQLIGTPSMQQQIGTLNPSDFHGTFKIHLYVMGGIVKMKDLIVRLSVPLLIEKLLSLCRNVFWLQVVEPSKNEFQTIEEIERIHKEFRFAFNSFKSDQIRRISFNQQYGLFYTLKYFDVEDRNFLVNLPKLEELVINLFKGSFCEVDFAGRQNNLKEYIRLLELFKSKIQASNVKTITIILKERIESPNVNKLTNIPSVGLLFWEMLNSLKIKIGIYADHFGSLPFYENYLFYVEGPLNLHFNKVSSNEIMLFQYLDDNDKLRNVESVTIQDFGYSIESDHSFLVNLLVFCKVGTNLKKLTVKASANSDSDNQNFIYFNLPTNIEELTLFGIKIVDDKWMATISKKYPKLKVLALDSLQFDLLDVTTIYSNFPSLQIIYHNCSHHKSQIMYPSTIKALIIECKCLQSGSIFPRQTQFIPKCTCTLQQPGTTFKNLLRLNNPRYRSKFYIYYNDKGYWNSFIKFHPSFMWYERFDFI
uniref:FTH domain-containing protein n=1 Tax=Rhabditophanes sp. KR3021 TaxID=114890 RepID=A0AC35TQV5_9BILA